MNTTDLPVAGCADCNLALRSLAVKYSQALLDAWRERLYAVVLFGSVARGEARICSDIDILIVAAGLPNGRLARQRCLDAIDALVEPDREAMRQRGIMTDFSPVLKTPEEAARLTPLYFDMIQDADILYEKDDFFSSVLERLRIAFQRLGSRRLQKGRVRYWELKPDYVQMEEFSI